jgi:hypothetical protein
MPVDVRGTIAYSKDAEDPYTIKCKQLGIEVLGTGAIEDDIEDLRERVTQKIAEEFKVSPSAVEITGYSMNLNFSIEGPINKTLDQFQGPEKEEVKITEK